jgi:hypothetical protein
MLMSEAHYKKQEKTRNPSYGILHPLGRVRVQAHKREHLSITHLFL